MNEPLTMPLAQILYQRRWQVCQDPFFHMVAYEVFTPDFYGSLERAYGELLSRGVSERPDGTRLSRSIPNYDVYSLSLSPATPAPFNVFTSREWHDVVANVVGIRTTGDVNGGFHHHSVGSKSGRVHNDMNPGWFMDSGNPYQVNVSRNELCNYSTGKASDSQIQVHETVRAIALLFYLHNAPWQRGDGGETGLYSHRYQPVTEPSKAIPPINNSLVLFECRPNSFHSFLSNLKTPRNSMIMWLHRPVEDVVNRWGKKAIVPWGSHAKNS